MQTTMDIKQKPGGISKKRQFGIAAWKFILISLQIFIAIGLVVFVYFVGLNHGIYLSKDQENDVVQVDPEIIEKATSYIEHIPYVEELDLPITRLTDEPEEAPLTTGPGGPDLWDAVNARRVELGNSGLVLRENLCTIAAIRLSELLAIGTLDGHAGFNKLAEERSDVQEIIGNYGTVFEYLAKGGQTSQETIGLWENSLGHSKLLKGSDQVYGCIYAQDTFAVAITAN